MYLDNNDIVLSNNSSFLYFKYLEWDSNFFGKKSYLFDITKSNINDLSSFDNAKLLDNCFVTAKIETKELELLYLFQSIGFYYIDTEVTLEYTHHNDFDNKNKIDILELFDNTIDTNAFKKAFSLTRFHTDKNIDNNKADLLWENYLKNYKADDTHKIFVAMQDNKIVGVILVNIVNDIAYLFFVSVINEYANMGIGSTLITSVTNVLSHKYKIRTGTQIKNINALNFYIKNGMNKIYNTQSILHKW